MIFYSIGVGWTFTIASRIVLKDTEVRQFFKIFIDFL